MSVRLWPDSALCRGALVGPMRKFELGRSGYSTSKFRGAPPIGGASPGSAVQNSMGADRNSDKPCNTGGLQPQGDAWISMQKLERQERPAMQS